MHISSNNNLPHISLILGKARGGPLMRVIYDTGAALTTGFLQYYLRIKNIIPDIVHSYEECDGVKPPDPIRLMGAIGNVGDYNLVRHGSLCAIIW